MKDNMYKQVAMELAYDLLPGMEKQLKIATDALKFCSVHLKSMESYSIIDFIIAFYMFLSIFISLKIK